MPGEVVSGALVACEVVAGALSVAALRSDLASADADGLGVTVGAINSAGISTWGTVFTGGTKLGALMSGGPDATGSAAFG
ncbi:MAG: hypothetical protein WCI74_05075 [Actinomycetes bacterium]